MVFCNIKSNKLRELKYEPRPHGSYGDFFWFKATETTEDYENVGDAAITIHWYAIYSKSRKANEGYPTYPYPVFHDHDEGFPGDKEAIDYIFKNWDSLRYDI